MELKKGDICYAIASWTHNFKDLEKIEYIGKNTFLTERPYRFVGENGHIQLLSRDEFTKSTKKQTTMRTEVKLGNGTLLEVGKKYRHSIWGDENSPYYECVAIGYEMWMWRDCQGIENCSYIVEDWIPYEETKKEKWYEYLVIYTGFAEKKYCDNEKMEELCNDCIILREWDSKENMINDLKKG